MIQFKLLHPRATMAHLGFLPQFWDERNPQTAAEQVNVSYPFGGWQYLFEGGTLDKETKALHYPGDPPLLPIAVAKLRDEYIYVYEHAIVMILQKDGSFEVSRLD